MRMRESTIDMVPSRIGGCALMKANDNCMCTVLTNIRDTWPHPTYVPSLAVDARALIKLT
jgi:hypothetical protein